MLGPGKIYIWVPGLVRASLLTGERPKVGPGAAEWTLGSARASLELKGIV